MITRPLTSILLVLLRELSLVWGFIRYDFSSTVVPATLAVIAAARCQGGLDALVVLQGALYFFFYVYTFAVSNQVVGLEEDRLNKPDRPLPAGLTTVRGAWVRWAIAMMLFPALGMALGVAWFALMWQACFCLYNFAGFARHWVTKSLIMGLGVIAQLGAAWAMVGPIPGLAWQWVLGMAIVAYVFCNIQDLRDMAGDEALRRRTLPIVHGLRRTCLALAALFAVGLPAFTHVWLFGPLPASAATTLSLVVLDGLSLLIAARLVLHQHPHGLHRTYLLFTYWYCAALASGCVVLPQALAPHT